MYRSSKCPTHLLNPKPSSCDETLVEASKFKVDVVTIRKDGRKEGRKKEGRKLIRSHGGDLATITPYRSYTAPCDDDRETAENRTQWWCLGTHTIRHKFSDDSHLKLLTTTATDDLEW